MDRYVIVLEADPAAHNLCAYAPDLPGCVATGITVEETIRHMREALWLHLGAMRRDGDTIPAPQHRVGDPVEVPGTVIGMVEVTPRPIRRAVTAA